MDANKLITKEELRRHLRSEVPVHIFDTIDSTNTRAKEMAAEGAAHGTTVIALQQTGGRGRLGRTFHSSAGTGIYMSIILRTGPDISKGMLTTAAAAVAVCRAIRNVCSADPLIKWVNDIYLNGKKVCGILTEAITGETGSELDALVVGIGINMSTEGFPENLLEIAGAVEGNYDASQLAATVINELFVLTDTLNPADFMDEYRDLSLVIGKTVKVYPGGYSEKETGISARVLDIDNSGGLRILYSSGQQEILSSGEISIRL